jgi:hypothetical protein
VVAFGVLGVVGAPVTGVETTAGVVDALGAEVEFSGAEAATPAIMMAKKRKGCFMSHYAIIALQSKSMTLISSLREISKKDQGVNFRGAAAEAACSRADVKRRSDHFCPRK